jgi:hypothetical protein
MNSFALATWETGIAKMLPTLLSVMAILCAGGCETTKKNQADSNTVIREPDKGTEIHGEVGAMYGSSSLSRH